ncbi:MAG TPA: tetratricopeptide repeat protein [Burkholderiaceae bacterium]|jgi:tetratricopeptide (TPR) repeat protein
MTQKRVQDMAQGSGQQFAVTVLEENIPLSQSMLWQASRRFYQEHGIEVWNRKVPYQVTSNPGIAHTYAQMIVRFLQDWGRRPDYAPDEPFFILELGAGHGMFSFYVLKCLLELRGNLGLDHVKFVYVVTDLAEKNIAWCREHKALQPFIAQGVLDFAQFNLEQLQPLRLMLSGKLLGGPGGTRNPVAVVANYIFDSLSQELFRLQDGHWQRGLVTLSAPASQVHEGMPTDPDGVQLAYTYDELPAEQAHDPVIAQLLAHYASENTHGHFLVPLAALRCIDHLRQLSNGKFLLLATDKGINRRNSVWESSDQLMGAYCSASMLVNFGILGDFFKIHHGDVRHQPTEQSILTSAFVLGAHFADLPETNQAVLTYVSTSGPGNAISLCNHLLNTNGHCSLPTLLAQFWAGNWDPYVFNMCVNEVINQLPHATASAKEDMLEGLHRIAANVYYLPGSVDSYYNIALVFQCLGRFEEAIVHYRLSLEWFQEAPYTWHNMGLCLNALNRPQEALLAFGQALKLEPAFILARGWISEIQSQLDASVN